jgi:hypothetical protein
MWPCIITDFLSIKPTDALIVPNLFLSRPNITSPNTSICLLLGLKTKSWHTTKHCTIL